MMVGLCLWGVLNNGASLGEALGNPVYWILSVVFGVLLALGAWKRRKS